MPVAHRDLYAVATFENVLSRKQAFNFKSEENFPYIYTYKSYLQK